MVEMLIVSLSSLGKHENSAANMEVLVHVQKVRKMKMKKSQL